MPTEPLTDEQIAELREDIKTGYGDAAEWIEAILDELELLRRRDREQAAGEEVLRQQVRDAERRIEMLRVELGQRGR